MNHNDLATLVDARLDASGFTKIRSSTTSDQVVGGATCNVTTCWYVDAANNQTSTTVKTNDSTKSATVRAERNTGESFTVTVDLAASTDSISSLVDVQIIHQIMHSNQTESTSEINSRPNRQQSSRLQDPDDQGRDVSSDNQNRDFNAPGEYLTYPNPYSVGDADLDPLAASPSLVPFGNFRPKSGPTNPQGGMFMVLLANVSPPHIRYLDRDQEECCLRQMSHLARVLTR